MNRKHEIKDYFNIYKKLKKININECVEIYTGAEIPKGADTILLQERVEIRKGHIISTNQNYKKAFEYYKKAAFGGLPQAQYNYALWLREGRVEDQRPVEEMEWFKVSSNKNFDRSLIELAKGYEDGTAGRRDYREAVKLYRRARANEDNRDNSPYLNSTFYLGKLYLRGLGVTKDEKKGLRFVREAANGNVSEAVLEMAKIYEQGRYCLLYTSPSPRDGLLSRMPSSA